MSKIYAKKLNLSLFHLSHCLVRPKHVLEGFWEIEKLDSWSYFRFDGKPLVSGLDRSHNEPCSVLAFCPAARLFADTVQSLRKWCHNGARSPAGVTFRADGVSGDLTKDRRACVSHCPCVSDTLKHPLLLSMSPGKIITIQQYMVTLTCCKRIEIQFILKSSLYKNLVSIF